MGIAMSSIHGSSIQVTITIDPRNEEAFLSALKPAFDATCAEPENTFIEVYKSCDKPGQFKLVENWNASREWLVEVATAESDTKAGLTWLIGPASTRILQTVRRCHKAYVD